jgi:hypothetical protein
MVHNESNPVIETQTEGVVTKTVKTTRGEIKEFERITWNYPTKQIKVTEADMFKMAGATLPAKINGM